MDEIEHSASVSALEAAWTATIEDEQAVSMLRHAPLRPRVNASLPAAIEIASPVAANVDLAVSGTPAVTNGQSGRSIPRKMLMLLDASMARRWPELRRDA